MPYFGNEKYRKYTVQKLIRDHRILMRGKNNVLVKKKTVFWKRT